MQRKILNVVVMAIISTTAVSAMDMEAMQDDERQSLGIKGTMQGEHQLRNMREHLTAISDIIRLMNTKKYDEASKIATEKLGLTLEKNTMCGSFKNDTFEKIGTSFHKAGDNLAQTLKTKDQEKSMVALERVLNACIVCHSTFKQ